MPLLTTVGMLMGGASAVKGFLGGGKMRSAGQRQLAQIEDVEFKNKFMGLKPSLEAERRLFGQSSTRMASTVDVAQGMDASTAMSLIGNTQEQLTDFEAQGIQSIVDKNYEADVLRAQDDVRIEMAENERNENRRREAISQINAGTQMQQSALEGAASLAISAGNAQTAASAEEGYKSPAVARRARRDANRAAGTGFLGKNTGVGRFLGKVGGVLGGVGQTVIKGITSLF